MKIWGFVNVGLYDKEHADICIFSHVLRKYLVKNVAEVLQMLQKLQSGGRWWNLVDTQVLGTCVARHVSSSLMRPTNFKIEAKFGVYIFSKQSISDFRLRDRLEACHLGCASSHCLRGI